ncbi:hypothetical protein PMZ80_010300 [Knufia obscura]|uniref:6-methylsalicylate decarboxylase n=2 Tax=Knufia TaxID=430999 RepID=A0AAN8EIS8_9EURO|nr:hypothetical protein PMZ80_010300 [Knufia obscura]KAK5951807.1 hypothetical protein OHC33_007099 [Knufia fluminis]
MAPSRIDVHHHYVPDFYRDAVVMSGGDPSGWFIPDWTPQSDQDINDKFGISTTILSLTAPGACILNDPQERANLARKANEYAAKLRDEQPKKYGFLAALPSLIDTDLALNEVAHAFDNLKADGITLFTRYGPDNHYLGHPDFKPIWTELNRRSAVILVHPTHPVDINQVSGLPQPVIRYPFETTTTALDMIHANVVRDNANCKIILSHGGGMLPYIIGRPASILPQTDEEHQAFMDQARSFYFDTAVAGSENVLKIIEDFAKPGHVLYGSDTPYANNHIIDYHTKGLDAFKFKNPNLREEINRTNAEALFPRLK